MAAWAGLNELIPRGEQEYKEIFEGVNPCDFSINLVGRENDGWEFSLQRNVAGGRQTYVVTLCKHMAAVVVSLCVPVLTQLNSMPFWWTRSQWQVQFGKEVSTECFANMEVIRVEFPPDDKNHYCLSWSAPNKAGHPPKNKRRKSVLEVTKGKRTKTTRPLTSTVPEVHSPHHQLLGAGEEEEVPAQKLDGPCNAGNDLATIDKAVVEDTLRRTAEGLPLGKGKWQNDYVEEEGIAE